MPTDTPTPYLKHACPDCGTVMDVYPNTPETAEHLASNPRFLCPPCADKPQSTQAMRDRLRELARPNGCDYDRAAIAIANDLENIGLQIARGFMTCIAGGGNDPSINIQFENLKDAQRLHSMLVSVSAKL